jgi:hypothetical protein
MRNTFLEVKIKDKFDQHHYLTYKIQRTQLAVRWLNLTKANLANANHKIDSVFNNRTSADVPEITDKINQIVLKINQLYDKSLPTYSIIDNAKLNYLHEEFEIFGERLDELHMSGKFSYELQDKFFALNEHIHMCEDAIVTEPNKWGGFGVLYDIHPIGLHLNVTEADKLLLESGFTWGRLYLGYNTLGKDWMAVSKDNDLEVINRGMVKPQKRFAAESWLNFNGDQEESNKVSSFIDWYSKLPSDTQKKVPLHNLNQLTFGRFPIGQVVIDDVFLKIDPNPDHWHLHRHNCKLQWNHEVLTTFRSIESIRTYEQDT